MRTLITIAFLILGNGLVFSEDKKLEPTYDYSTSREQKIKLAESAAPVEISSKAAVYVLELGGYEKVREGTNGFTCFVGSTNSLEYRTDLLRRGRYGNDPANAIIRRAGARKGEKRGPNSIRTCGWLQGRPVQSAQQTRHRIHAIEQYTSSCKRQNSSRASTPYVLCAVCHRKRHRIPSTGAKHASLDQGRTTGCLHDRDARARVGLGALSSGSKVEIEPSKSA